MKNVHVFVPVFLYAVTVLIFHIKRILFQVKNGVTTSLLFFVLKMPNIWVGRMTVNGERKRGWPNLVLCLTKFVDTLLQPISKSTEIIPFTEKTNVRNRTFLVSMDVLSLDTNIQQNEGILKFSVTKHMKISTKTTHSYKLLAGNA